MDRVSQREWVVKLLFEIEFNNYNIEDIDRLLENHNLQGIGFIKQSLYSTVDNKDQIDKIIKNYLTNIPFEKISNIDKSIIRTAINEFIIEKSVPTSVSINEAVEIAKKYSREDSYKFINGLLSTIEKDLT